MMGLGWLYCFVEKSDRTVLDGWIFYWLAGLYRLDRNRWISLELDRIGWIGSAGLDWIIMAG